MISYSLKALFAAMTFGALFVFTMLGIVTLFAQSNLLHFVQGKINIELPVKLLKSKEGYVMDRNFNDGGTRMVTIIDAEGRSIDVYIDHRIDKKDSWGTIYVFAYPDDPGSIRIKDQALFAKEILKPIGEE